ncbi:MAG: segregation/condensation protein A [Actinomycetes bacterium]|nr:segregation/condensation protein A [Actinomycetes bacterium]
MANYTIHTEHFEGPFDLLLHLVSRQKLDVGAISVSEIADQYLAHIESMQERDLDLDLASEFLLLASTLLEIKAASLLPKEDIYVGEDIDDLAPEEMRDLLVARLLSYKQFKNIATALAARSETEGKMHARQAGLEAQFAAPLPDYLEGVTLHTLALMCAELEYRRDTFLLEAEHIAAMPISLEEYAEGVRTRLKKSKRLSFSELLPADPAPEVIVVTFLAILELYKRGVCDLSQPKGFDRIELRRLSRREGAKRGIQEEAFDEY